MGLFDKLRAGLDKTRKAVTGQFEELFSGGARLDEDFYEQLEETLILADLGVETALRVTGMLRDRIKEEKIRQPEQAKDALREILTDILSRHPGTLRFDTVPAVILVVGVNGVGKTTTIGKLANILQKQGKRVLLCAADTFRAAAADQLEIWAARAQVELVRQDEGADPAAVVFDALAAAKARHCDVVICDTAGRLHNKQNLMNELNKISRVIDRELPGACRETLMVLDATTGQNGLNQARQFRETADVSGIVLTKLDGTAKGGIVFAVSDTLNIPVKFVGVGEGIDDLMPFDPRAFVDAIL